MFVPRIVAAALVLAIASPALAAEPPPAAVIKLEPYRTRWAVDATVGGHPGKFLLDTGGGVTLMSRTLSEAAGCRPWGRLSGFNMFGKRLDEARCEGLTLKVQGQALTPAVTGLIDMGANNPNDASLAGLLSLDAFAGSAITLDLKGGRLIVESPESLAARTASLTPLPTRLVHEVQGLSTSVMIGAPSAKGTLWLELDSGNGGTILVSKPVAPLLGLDPDKEGPQHASFEVAPGVRVESDDAFTPDLIYDGNLGMPFLRNWLITLDLEHGRAWLAPQPG